ncbi:protein S40-1 [Lycium barbarum]|uniref:protein S40-1 n=1 Tax=Lycium barbarum TaxID=112863 RepID=UPI00293E53D2|nr:protein S40-1 [Lycium barbarum]
MEEEFQESEVIFQENISNEEIHEENDQEEYYKLQNRDSIRSNTRKLQSRKRPKRMSNSVPINIPENLSRNSSWFKYVENNESRFLEDGEYDDGEMVPPHVITSRRIAGKMMTFSVCSGYGRTLKGRDLSQVRNSILRMTGFLET